MPKILSIIGPTATGKTKLALEIARSVVNNFAFVDLISVDSRQLYKGMEIGTGVDLPAEFKQVKTTDFPETFFLANKVRVHGLSILTPDQEWSVMQQQVFVQNVIEKSLQQNGLPILVGGTGFYQYHLFDSNKKSEFSDMYVPPNLGVRQKTERMTVADLQKWAKEVDHQKYIKMNNSDQQNPRRLVRVIEIGLAKNSVSSTQKASQIKVSKIKLLTIGLTDTIEHITKAIEQRVLKRLENGMINEVQTLMANYSPQIWHDMPAFSATGYKEVHAFLEEKISREEMIELWTRREVQYAKRQMTWFKKYAADAKWFDVDQRDTVYSKYEKIL